MPTYPVTAKTREACEALRGVPCDHRFHRKKYDIRAIDRMTNYKKAPTRRASSGRRGKFTAYGEASIPGFGSAGFTYSSKRLMKGTNYVAPASGIATSMRTSNNPVMTASKNGAVVIKQREILTTVTSSIAATGSNFNLEVLDVNPGLSTICSWGSQIAKAFQEYRMKFKLIYTASCPSSESGQLLLAFDHNVGNPTIPQDKQQMSNFAGCTSSQVWAPMESTMQSSMKKFYIREGPVPTGQSIQLYDFTKILIGLADLPGVDFSTTYGTIYIEYELELFMPRLQYNDESIIFSQYAQNEPYKSKAEIVALDYRSPQMALCGVSGDSAFGTTLNKLPAHVAGSLEVQALIDYQGMFNIVFPQAGYYSLTLGCYSSVSTEVGGASFLAWSDPSAWELGNGIQGIWSVTNTTQPPDGTKAGALGLIGGGDLPDDVTYTEQNMFIWVTSVGSWVDQQYAVFGDSWISIQTNDLYRVGNFETDTRVNSSFIIITPVGGDVLNYFNPGFLPIPTPTISGLEHMRNRAKQKFGSKKIKKITSSKAASSVPSDIEERSEYPSITEKYIDSLEEELRKARKALSMKE